jgi:V/A-type H+-transporting ATPase subunit K
VPLSEPDRNKWFVYQQNDKTERKSNMIAMITQGVEETAKFISGYGDFNFSLTLAAIGSAFGTGVAGMAAIGAWKRAFAQNKAAPFILVAFVGAPLSQTIYGMILRNAIQSAEYPAGSQYWQVILIGALAGIAMGLSAFMQGKAGAKASDALAETGKGFGNYIMVIGVIETVALFVMVFAMTALGAIAG